MKTKFKWVVFLLLLTGLLVGCEDTKEEEEEEEELTINGSSEIQPVEVQKTTKDIKISIEDTIESGRYVTYYFNGFANGDTLSFEKKDGYRSINVFHPAEIGYVFKLKEIEGTEFEILDFSREEGYVNLRINLINE